MMLNKNDIKIKYIVGTFRDDVNYPTQEDFRYLILNWYWNEGGHNFIHSYRAIEETGNPIFPDNILKEKLDGDEEATSSLLNSLLAEGVIAINKSTKFTSYYEIIK
jgi:hypothetical protein